MTGHAQLHAPGRGLHELLPALVGAVRGTSQSVVELPPGVRAVGVIVIDGLGARQLDEHRSVAPNLSAAGVSRQVLNAAFPTTTVTNLAGIGTGRPAGEHGLTGAAFVPDDSQRAFFGLSWGWQAPPAAGGVVDEVVPETLQPHPTAFDQARAVGVRPFTVLRNEFAGTGLTRAALRGGEVVRANGLTATLNAVREVLSMDDRRIVYAHHGRLDLAGHLHGPGSSPWLEELARVDEALSSMAATLPTDTVVVVTADHGMVAVEDAGCVELAEEPALLAGVAVVAGEPRARYLHVIPGARADVVAAWREHVADDGLVLTREEVLEAGWFGPLVEGRVRGRVGDVVVAARVPSVAWVHREVDPMGGRLAGQHGGITPEEIEVPAVVLRR